MIQTTISVAMKIVTYTQKNQIDIWDISITKTLIYLKFHYN